jgi:hypothetical protein
MRSTPAKVSFALVPQWAIPMATAAFVGSYRVDRQGVEATPAGTASRLGKGLAEMLDNPSLDV